ncbi:MAG TPA: enoyl-CoA hydratase/isomerase family protein [Symbiobacteriaceae bacterium]|nr:enoyl-CoA hydratase/isomerase family protein [Symbiobacteriaceae bacterium]
MSDDRLLVEIKNRVATVTLNRPDVLNCMSTADKLRLARCIEDLGRDEQVRVVVITGAGDRSFCAGSDIGVLEQTTSDGIQQVEEIEHQLFGAIRRIPQPVVGRVNGYALGAGLGLSMSCDITIAVESAKFGQPEVGLGIGAPAECLMLPALVGYARARYMFLTGELVGAAEAARIGLINEVVPAAELDARVNAVVERLLSFAPAGLAANKRFMNAWLDHGLAAAVDLSIGLQGAVFAHPETKETIRRFLDRKKKS